MYSRWPWSAQKPAERQEVGRHSLCPATTQAWGKSTCPAARSEQERKLWLWVMFPSPGLVLGQRDMSALCASSASPLGLAPAGQACCTYAVKNRDGGFVFEYLHKQSFMSSKQGAHLNHFLSICSLCIARIYNTALAGWLHANLGARLCCWVLPALTLSVKLATVAQVPPTITGMKPFSFPDTTEVALM